MTAYNRPALRFEELLTVVADHDAAIQQAHQALQQAHEAVQQAQEAVWEAEIEAVREGVIAPASVHTVIQQGLEAIRGAVIARDRVKSLIETMQRDLEAMMSKPDENLRIFARLHLSMIRLTCLGRD